MKPIKLCPFCNGFGKAGKEELFKGCIIAYCGCTQCSAKTFHATDIDKAIEAWNTRKED
jgi:hypothetical protein